MVVVIREDLYKELRAKAEIADWLKEQFPLVHDLAELELANRKEQETSDVP